METAGFSGELEYANHDSRSKLCNSKLVYWYVYDPRTVWCSRSWFAFYTRKRWGHWYFLPRQALTRRLDFGTLKSWEIAVILDSIGSRVVVIHPTQCIMTHPFHATSLHSFIHSFLPSFLPSFPPSFLPAFLCIQYSKQVWKTCSSRHLLQHIWSIPPSRKWNWINIAVENHPFWWYVLGKNGTLPWLC